MVCAIEDAGFSIRDMVEWIYGSGFPKNANSALKPAHEPICLARKSLSEKTIKENIEKWGVGGLNINDCRIGNELIKEQIRGKPDPRWVTAIEGGVTPEHIGRWPTNAIFNEEAGKLLDEQSGECLGCKPHWVEGKHEYKGWGTITKAGKIAGYNDSGGASRFFYCPKVSKREREFGCEELEIKNAGCLSGRRDGTLEGAIPIRKNHHPTVKPIRLLQYLCRLITPTNGIVFDPFLGSGSTGVACKLEGFHFIGFEQDVEYCKIASCRVNAWEKFKED
jgi:site-specific DNA-methyltransferase (adenine-specific)